MKVFCRNIPIPLCSLLLGGLLAAPVLAASNEEVRIAAPADSGRGPAQDPKAEVALPLPREQPLPADGSTATTALTMLDWADIKGASSYEVYFGTHANLGRGDWIGTDSLSQWPLKLTLEPETTYYWRIVSKNSYGDLTGVVWRFRTAAIPPPAVPSTPLPADGQTTVSLSLVALDWADAKGAGWYGLYFGTTPKLGLDHFKGDVTVSSWRLDRFLVPEMEYYWQVVAMNASGSKTGAVWRFTTKGASPPSGF